MDLYSWITFSVFFYGGSWPNDDHFFGFLYFVVVRRSRLLRNVLLACSGWQNLFNFFFGGATAWGGPWPPLQYASKSLYPLLCLSIRLFPSFSGPCTRNPAISFLVFLFVLLHTAFRSTSFFWDCGVLHSFYMTKPSYSLAFSKPDNVLPLNYGF